MRYSQFRQPITPVNASTPKKGYGRDLQMSDDSWKKNLSTTPESYEEVTTEETETYYDPSSTGYQEESSSEVCHGPCSGGSQLHDSSGAYQRFDLSDGYPGQNLSGGYQGPNPFGSYQGQNVSLGCLEQCRGYQEGNSSGAYQDEGSSGAYKRYDNVGDSVFGPGYGGYVPGGQVDQSIPPCGGGGGGFLNASGVSSPNTTKSSDGYNEFMRPDILASTRIGGDSGMDSYPGSPGSGAGTGCRPGCPGTGGGAKGGTDGQAGPSQMTQSDLMDSLGSLEKNELSTILSDLSTYQSARRKLVFDASNLSSVSDVSRQILNRTV